MRGDAGSSAERLVNLMAGNPLWYALDVPPSQVVLVHVQWRTPTYCWERTGDINSWWSKSRDDEIDGSPAEGVFPVRPLAPSGES